MRFLASTCKAMHMIVVEIVKVKVIVKIVGHSQSERQLVGLTNSIRLKV